MSSIEHFKEAYGLYNEDARLLEQFLTGHEEVLNLTHAMRERAMEEGEIDGKDFLAASLIDEELIRLFFRQGDVIYYWDIARRSSDPEIDILLDMAGRYVNVEIGYIPPPSNRRRRPN